METVNHNGHEETQRKALESPGIADIAGIWFFRSRRFRAITAITAISFVSSVVRFPTSQHPEPARDTQAVFPGCDWLAGYPVRRTRAKARRSSWPVAR